MKLKINYSYPNTNNSDLQNIIIHQEEIVKNKILLPKNRKIHKPLKQWIDELRTELNTASTLFVNCDSAKKITSIFNDAVIIFMAINQIKYARDICYSQIKMFIDWSEITGDKQFLPFILQAWLNLIRIDRLTDNMDDAFKKIDVFLNNSKLMKNKLSFIPKPNEMYHNMTTNILRERINLYLHAHSYVDLIKFLESQTYHPNSINNSIKQEALAIGLANQGKLADAQHLLAKAKFHSTSIAEYVFYLREYEIQSFLTRKNFSIHGEKCFLDTSLRFMQNNKMNVDIILIGLHAVNLLQDLELLDDAAKLTYFCLQGAYHINDELLKADCLVKLHTLIQEAEGKRIIENLMIEHYYHTQYVIARRKMLDCFHDLKHVESKYHHDDPALLFEDLLIFSSLSKR